ncbi:2-aminoethylphosphonate--pyruvate transaminase [Paenibacillus sp. MER 180]|uniref:2-aminoethylphosphonate aminotransferase n=1 Tax=Paenibacillus sp. MER 180 TaxID=2939570 RepID=UPI002040C9FD|nr:2-aminoethylphosphonate--pyruvate transaminase [Paenibacillus sp. MER 180]MCM3288714.1 2-aminoethylphosphonate--pyruvate transaminase [Paenibacillus sp. MER 180]
MMRPVMRNILLNPGPATTTDTVKYAQVVPDICPREEEFGLLMESITDELTQLVATSPAYTSVLFGGSGTAAVESIISSVVGDDTIIIINNGAYGRRMCEIAHTYGISNLEYSSPPDQAIDIGKLEQLILSCSGTVSHLAAVHMETTTGLLNDVYAIGQLCKSHGIDFIVDAMSSFGAIPIQMDEMNISYLAASSNKCLQGMPGVGFVIGNTNKIASLQDRKPRNYYLNLFQQHQYFAKTRQMRFTPPVQTLYALHQAIEELKQEGVHTRYNRYRQSWETLVVGLERLGLTYIVDREHHSRLVTSILEPECVRYDFQQMHDYLYAAGFTIYPGKLDNRGTFRIANIGDISHQDITAFLHALENYLQIIDFL